MRNRIHTLNTIIDNLNMQETLQVINDTIDSGAQLHQETSF